LRRTRYTTPIVTSKLNEYPKGYPNVAAFLDSDEGFTIYRRFGYLQSRILLDKQEDLRRAEKKLKRMESRMTKDNENRMCFRDIRGPDGDKHRQLLRDIETKFYSYCECLMKGIRLKLTKAANVLAAAQKMMALGKPGDADRESVGRYMFNRKAIDEEEASWIKYRDDLVTLRPGREHAWLDGIVEGLLKICHCKLIDIMFRSKVSSKYLTTTQLLTVRQETRKKTEITSENMPARPPKDEDKYEIYYTPSRIAMLTNGILAIIILALLVVPIYILYHMVYDVGTRDAYMTCIGTLLIFTLAFSAILSLFTKARRHEILAAAAAYCAVLVVFLGNVGPSSGPPGLG